MAIEEAAIELNKHLVMSFEFLFLLAFVAIIYYLHKIKSDKTIKNIVISFIGLVFLNLVIDPLITNKNFSAWTYYYHDLSLLIGMFLAIFIGVIISLVDKYYWHSSKLKRLVMYCLATDLVVLIIEFVLSKSGFREYATTIGNLIPFSKIPIVLMFEVYALIVLVITFTKFWERIFRKDKTKTY